MRYRTNSKFHKSANEKANLITGNLYCDTLVGIRPDLDVDGVVFDIVAEAEHPVGHKLGEPKAQLIGISHLAGPLEVGPAGVGDERFDNVDGALAVRVLVHQGEGDGVAERPLEDAVIVTGQNLDVDGEVGVLPAPVAAGEQGDLQLVAGSRGVERPADQLEAVAGFGLSQLLGEAGDLPDEDAVFAEAGPLQLLLEPLDVGLLRAGGAGQQVQVHLGAVQQVLLHHGGVAAPAAAAQLGVRAGGQGLAAAGPMGLHLLPPAIFAATVGTGHRELGAGHMVRLQRVRGKRATAIFAVYQPLGARVYHVGLEAVASHPLAALVLTVERLKAARVLMLLNIPAAVGPLAEDAVENPLAAGVHHVVGHVDAGNLGAASVHTENGILLAGDEMTLELGQAAAPRTALRPVDTVHTRLHDPQLDPGVLLAVRAEELQAGAGLVGAAPRGGGGGRGLDAVHGVGVEVEGHHLLLQVGHLLVVGGAAAVPRAVVQVCHGRVLGKREELKGLGSYHGCGKRKRSLL